MLFKHKNGTQTYYETYGERTSPSVLLIHGIGADHGMWAPQKDLLISENIMSL